MCGGDGPGGGGATAGRGTGVSRRTFLAGTAAAALLLPRLPARAVGLSAVDLGGVDVLPRAAWAGDLAPVGPVPAEPDVRYLLVHHSVDPGNAYGEDDVAGILRGFFRFHTSSRGWPDLAYNFLVDRFGRVWEGRAGSLAGPVAGDATGGNQGFDQLCCFVGNHQDAEPSPAAFAAMGRLLGALARRHGIAVGPDAATSFTSRGSNRHPAGTVVSTATITGHREMSRTQCPGDRVVARLAELRLAAAASAAGTAPAAPSTPQPTTSPPSTAAPATTAAPSTTAPAASTAAPAASTAPVPSSPGTVPVDRFAGRPASPSRAGPDDGGPPAGLLVGAATAVAATAAGAAVASRRRRVTPPPPTEEG